MYFVRTEQLVFMKQIRIKVFMQREIFQVDEPMCSHTIYDYICEFLYNNFFSYQYFHAT